MATKLEKTVLGGLGLSALTAAGLLIFAPPSGDVSSPRADFALPPAKQTQVLNQKFRTGVTDVTMLEAGFDKLNYVWADVVAGQVGVPQLFVPGLPADLGDLAEVDRRKAIFFRIMLPLVLRANAEIERDRARVEALSDDLSGLSDNDMDWLAALLDRYRVDLDHKSKAELLHRIDIIPPSLALAQAAEESGWGTSRFAQEGNALFGQWTTEGPGLVPEDREEGKTHKVRAFETLYQSVRSYGDNLNRHKAYRELREARAKLRSSGEAISGLALAKTLTRYSERGEAYVESLSSLIRSNDLDKIDGVQFRRGQAGS